MGYELSVSEVGPAEYPLIEVLRETIFGEAGHVSRATIAETLDGRQDVFSLIAHLEGNPVGYKVGYRFGPGVYCSSSGGVLKEYRRNGLARQMQTWQHGWARARGYERVFFNSFNHFKDMIRFGLATGFVPVGAERQSVGDLSFKFARNLSAPDASTRRPVPVAEIQVEMASPLQLGLIAAMASLAGGISDGDVEAELNEPGVGVAVASLDTKPVGFALGRALGGGVYRTTRLGVVDTYQGRGAETALAKHQVEIGRRLGNRIARWEVRHDDTLNLRAGLDAGYDFTGIHHTTAARRTRVVLETVI